MSPRPDGTPSVVVGMEHLPLESIRPSKTNPRREINGPALEELVASVQAKGVLQPILVRPLNGHYELVAGHRRFVAAQKAGLAEIPAVVRQLDDVEALELQVIENLQRADLHPLEEAQGYHQLMQTAGYDAARIAERTGRSVKYVYDRVKLLALTKEAQKLFLDGMFAAGHAILLARLKPADQARALEMSERGVGGVFQEERTLWDPEDKEPEEAKKPRSVREFQGWIDEHVRFDLKRDADPMLFPETVKDLALAGTGAPGRSATKKVVPITYLHYIQPEAREGRTFSPRSWKRADGQESSDPVTGRKQKSKPCDFTVTGFVAVGPRRGDAFAVCIDKDHCDVHWQASKRKQAKPAGTATAVKSRPPPESWEIQHKKEQAEKARWEKARPHVLAALAAAVRKASPKPGGPLAMVLVKAVAGYHFNASVAAKLVPAGCTAEDLVRHCVFVLLSRETQYVLTDTFRRSAGALGVNTKKLLDEHSPVQTSAKGKTATSGTCSKCGCTDEAACEGGCAWVDQTRTKCSACFPPKTAMGRSFARTHKAGKARKKN